MRCMVGMERVEVGATRERRGQLLLQPTASILSLLQSSRLFGSGYELTSAVMQTEVEFALQLFVVQAQFYFEALGSPL